MSTPFLIAKGSVELFFDPKMANRHGLIAGATGTGKTVTLMGLAENFSSLGVPVFLADVKGDLSGLAQPGTPNPKIDERVQQLGLDDFAFTSFPVVFWDIFGESGHPIRATVSEMGPLLLARVLNLNETQEGVLQLAFRVADENGLLLLDLDDLRAIITLIGSKPPEITDHYGTVSSASIGAIQRALLQLEQQGGGNFFGEPALNLDDFLQTGDSGRGVINILAADKLMSNPRTYATALLWLLSELFERLPEVGDLDKPKLVFFFDEAHLLFDDIPGALQDKVEQVVRLIRSKGVGVYFVTQNPIDIPEKILGQLGNRVQHALRAFSPRDQKAVQSAAQTFRQNPKLNVEETITQLAVGEALVSLLDHTGTPGIVERAFILPPRARIGPITDVKRQEIIKASVLYGTYETPVNRESAAEKLRARVATLPGATGSAVPRPGAAAHAETGIGSTINSMLFGSTGPRGARREGILEAATKSAVRSVGSGIGRSIVRGLLGSVFGGGRR